MPDDRGSTHILIVDDEVGVRTLLRDCLQIEGYRISEAADGAGLEAQLAREPVDLITLDINLGGENGLDIARRIRSANKIPIIMITGKGDTIDRVVGLELGADDYIVKPFQLREVLARVRAVLRRYAAPATLTPVQGTQQATERHAFENCILDLERRELLVDGELRELTTAEFDLLVVLLRNAGRVLSRDSIMDQLRGHEWSPLDRTIDGLIVRLRRKIEPAPDAPRIVKTVRGVGYVFSASVRRV